MENLSYNQILEHFTNNSILLIIALALLTILIAFIISKTLRKSGLFLLVISFILEKFVEILPINLYKIFPQLSMIFTIMYIVSFILFGIKIIKRLFGKGVLKYQYKEGSKPTTFFKYTGSLPFFIMLIVNVLNIYYDFIPKSILSPTTSLTFLYMAFISLFNTYKYLDRKELSEDYSRMHFEDIKRQLNDDTDSIKKIDKNSNKGRKVIKSNNNTNDNSETKKINIEDKTEIIKKDEETIISNKKSSKKASLIDKEKRISVKDIKYRDQIRYNPKKKKIEESEDLLIIKKELSNIDLLSLVTNGFKDPLNKTTITIKNLNSGEITSYTSNKCIAKIEEELEYKVDIEFENYNDYDYGKFIDILMIYSQNKNKFKFELELIPASKLNSKVVFYDPSELFDQNNIFSKGFQGKNISMNFPKYKINFITGN